MPDSAPACRTRLPNTGPRARMPDPPTEYRTTSQPLSRRSTIRDFLPRKTAISRSFCQPRRRSWNGEVRSEPQLSNVHRHHHRAKITARSRRRKRRGRASRRSPGEVGVARGAGRAGRGDLAGFRAAYGSAGEVGYVQVSVPRGGWVPRRYRPRLRHLSDGETMLAPEQDGCRPAAAPIADFASRISRYEFALPAQARGRRPFGSARSGLGAISASAAHDTVRRTVLAAIPASRPAAAPAASHRRLRTGGFAPAALHRRRP